MWLASGMVVVLVGLGVLVRYSRWRQYLGNIMVPCSLVAVCALFLILSLDFPVTEGVGPRAVPLLWSVLILILSGIILAQVLRGEDKVPPKVERMGLVLLVMATLVAYFVAISYLGYFLSTFLFIVVALNMLSYPRKALTVVIAGGWVVFSYFFFYKLLYTQLPLGIFEDLFH